MWTKGSRRDFLRNSALGIGWLAAMDLFGQAAAETSGSPLAARPSPLPATAKRVIHLFMQGGAQPDRHI